MTDEPPQPPPDGSPPAHDERAAQRQRVDTTGRAVPIDPGARELAADKKWHEGKNLPFVEIGGTVTLVADERQFTFTRRANREWKCDVDGCMEVMGLKKLTSADGDVSFVENKHGTGRQQFIAHARVR